MIVEQTGIDERTASRDLKALVDVGLLRAVGETKGRHYVAGPALHEVGRTIGPVAPLTDPYPWMPAELVRLTTTANEAT